MKKQQARNQLLNIGIRFRRTYLRFKIAHSNDS